MSLEPEQTNALRGEWFPSINRQETYLDLTHQERNAILGENLLRIIRPA